MANFDSWRLPGAQINPFRPFITEELKKRKNTFPTPTYTPFIRLVSCLEEPVFKYKYFTMGLQGYETNESIFDQVYGTDRDVAGYAYRSGRKTLIDTSEISARDLDPVFSESDPRGQQIRSSVQNLKELISPNNLQGAGAHPIPGVSGLHLDRFNDGAGTRARITWACYNQHQLEFLRHHFLTIGTTVAIDWGHMRSDYQPENLLDYKDPNISNILANCFTNRPYIVKTFCAPNEGNYDILVGEVFNFDVEFDARNNVYHCTTHVVGPGEYIYGVQTANTSVSLNRDDYDSSIHEFFMEGGEYDFLVNSKVGHVDVTEDYQGEPLITTADLPGTNQGEVHKFVSWGFFSLTLMQALGNKFLEGVEVYQREKILSILNFSAPPEGEYSSPMWVGNNRHLKSTNPDVMVIANKGMDIIHEEFDRFPKFGQTAPGYDRGILSEGVWLNSEMIRTAFLESRDLQSGIRTVLRNMNSATANYWDLRLFFDEKLNRYTIIDHKFVDISAEPYNFVDPDTNEQIKFHMFNKGNNGETLELTMDSSYPPEVVVQLALTAKITQSPDRFAEFLDQYPMLANSGYFAYALNWSGLKSTVSDEINSINRKRLQAQGIELSDHKKPNAEDRTEISHTERVVGTSGAPVGASNLVAKKEIRPDGSVLGNNWFMEPAENMFPQRAVEGSTGSDVEDGDRRVLTQLTIAEILQLQREGKVFAVGRFQFIPVTFLETVEWAERTGVLETRQVQFTKEVQDRLADYLFFYKGGRRTLSRFLRGENVSITQAHRELSLEFASVPNPNTGQTSHGPTERVAHQNSQVINALNAARQEYARSGTIMTLKDFISRGEGGPDDINRGTGGDTRAYTDIYYDTLNSTFSTGASRGVVEEDSEPEAGRDTPISRPGRESGATFVPPSLENTTPTPSEGSPTSAEERKKDIIATKYGNYMIGMIALNSSQMLRDIVRDGINNHDNFIVNGFLAPFPITTKIELKVPGISGMALYDGFFVDKLPYIYSLYGIFQATSITESVTPTGWVTEIGGIYRFLYFNPRYMGFLRDKIEQ